MRHKHPGQVSLIRSHRCPGAQPWVMCEDWNYAEEYVLSLRRSGKNDYNWDKIPPGHRNMWHLPFVGPRYDAGRLLVNTWSHSLLDESFPSHLKVFTSSYSSLNQTNIQYTNVHKFSISISYHQSSVIDFIHVKCKSNVNWHLSWDHDTTIKPKYNKQTAIIIFLHN